MSYQEERLTEIADAIREKDGTTEPIIATDFADRILAIPSGGETQEKTATVIDELQEVVPDSGYTLSKVTVPPTRAKTRLAELVDGSIEVVARSEFEGITSIGEHAFYNLSNLTSIVIPDSVTSIGDNAFRNCTSLTSITFESGSQLISIETYAFSGCSSLTSITLPNSVTSIGRGVFSGCTSLTSMTIPSSVTSIRNDAFYGCTSLTSIDLANVTSIGNYVFKGCTSLASIIIPSSVTSIGDFAFYGCSTLSEITCLATTPPTLSSTNAFSSSGITASAGTIRVPSANLNAYKTATNWSTYANIMVGI